jgi:lipid-A-disaccharide synthase
MDRTTTQSATISRGARIFVVAAEESGDRLGAALMRALRERTGGTASFSGIGGQEMAHEGVASPFPIEELSIVGFSEIPRKLPMILRRIREASAAIIAAKPDVLVIIDSPDFTHRVARRVRQVLPGLPIIDYVSPSVWAWRPGRARAMRAYVDCLLALLPFEPAAHQRLGGPPCFYVGHPLIERLAELRPNANEAARRAGAPPLIVALPGSRRSIMRRLIDDFGGALALLAREIGALEVVLPTMPHLAAEITERTANWPVAPRIVLGEEAKLAAFRNARAALAASGTVTLELALAGVPMIGAYKVSLIEEPLKYVVKAPSILLPNLILGARAIPEILQRECTPQSLADALAALVGEGAPRDAQLGALARLDALMQLPDGDTPSARAARLVLRTIAEAQARASGV